MVEGFVIELVDVVGVVVEKVLQKVEVLKRFGQCFHDVQDPL